MTQFPDSNLQVASQTWGRAVENSINSIELQIEQNEKNNTTRDANLKTSVDAIASTLLKVKTLASTDHKRYDFNGGTTPTRTPVLTFTKPEWAKSATILATAMVDASADYTGGVTQQISGVLRMFVDGNQTTYTGYDFGDTGLPYTANNYRGLTVTAPVSGTATGSVLISHSATHDVGESELNIWASFSNTESNEITPIAGDDPWWDLESLFNPTFTNRQMWSVGVTAAASCSVEIMATVIWNIDPA